MSARKRETSRTDDKLNNYLRNIKRHKGIFWHCVYKEDKPKTAPEELTLEDYHLNSEISIPY